MNYSYFTRWAHHIHTLLNNYENLSKQVIGIIVDQRYSVKMMYLIISFIFSNHHTQNRLSLHHYIRDCTRDEAYAGLVIYIAGQYEYSPWDHAMYREIVLEVLLFYIFWENHGSHRMLLLDHESLDYRIHHEGRAYQVHPHISDSFSYHQTQMYDE